MSGEGAKQIPLIESPCALGALVIVLFVWIIIRDVFLLIFGGRVSGKDKQKCKQCGGEMGTGIAIEQTYTGIADFPGDSYPVTVSAGGTGKLVECDKCKDCGWSTT